MGDNIDNRLQQIEKKIAQLKAQKQAILSRSKARERKERTHRLIQVGAILEQYLNIHSVLEAEALGKLLVTDKDKLTALKQRINEKAANLAAERQGAER